MSRDYKWDKRFIDLADHVKLWSKDESTKVAAIITDDENHIRAISYNGFPKGIKDDDRLKDRQIKYTLIQHAESNAITTCASLGISTQGLTMIVTTFPCSKCAGLIVSSGIKRIVTRTPSIEFMERWKTEIEIGKSILIEAGVEITIL